MYHNPGWNDFFDQYKNDIITICGKILQIKLFVIYPNIIKEPSFY